MNDENIANNSQLFQMRLQVVTSKKLNSLIGLTNVHNKSQLVALCIDLTEEIVRNIREGNKVYIESKDGKTRERLKLVGL